MTEAERKIREASEHTAQVARVIPSDSSENNPVWAAIYKGKAYDVTSEAAARDVATALDEGSIGFYAAPGWRLVEPAPSDNDKYLRAAAAYLGIDIEPVLDLANKFREVTERAAD